MALYTKTGDDGTCEFRGMRVSKASPVIEVLGSLDECASAISAAAAFSDHLELGQALREILPFLTRLCGEIAGGPPADAAKQARLWEAQIDRYQAVTGGFFGFSYPTSKCAVLIDFARTVARRAERAAVKEGILGEALVAINRLSDYLYALSRYAEWEYEKNKNGMGHGSV